MVNNNEDKLKKEDGKKEKRKENVWNDKNLN